LKNSIITALAALALAGCTARTTENLAQVEVRGGGPSPSAVGHAELSSTAAAAHNSDTAFGERYDPVAEPEIAKETLRAWRVAVKHAKRNEMPEVQWKAQRASDEKESMEILNALAEQYPKSSTVRFMMGQVQDHFGKHDKAVQHYQASTENNRNNGMYMFKLAEAESKAGQYDKAIAHYRLILEHNPGAVYQQACHLGLARTLLKKDPKNAEAKQILDSLLKAQPNNQEAKVLLQGAK
jgi:tetratricopeptide (TPR) repeat protein